jgi:hypothetical protein
MAWIGQHHHPGKLGGNTVACPRCVASAVGRYSAEAFRTDLYKDLRDTVRCVFERYETHQDSHA